ncbi:Uncharacterised protein [Mycobacteroides abscessus subsp. abscessus]|nr:Uncharacterised protein [Mycobacteroides abscessus subsp. abscessus]
MVTVGWVMVNPAASRVGPHTRTRQTNVFSS